MIKGYTVYVRDIIDNIYYKDHEHISIFEHMWYDFDLSELDTKIEYARTKIFSFTYPGFDNADDKKHLEHMILSHYYDFEINYPSVQRWQRNLRDKLNEIMPKYVEMYNSQKELIVSDILNPYQLNEEQKEDNKKLRDKLRSMVNVSDSEYNDTSSGNTNSTSKDTTERLNDSKYSDTPQTQVTDPYDYLTNATKDESKDVSKSKSNQETSDESSGSEKSKDRVTEQETNDNSEINKLVRSVKGNLGKISLSELTRDYQNAIMNIESKIIDDLADCFFGLFAQGGN